MKHLKQLRQQRQLSQQKLADYLMVSQQSIYKYENDLAEPDFATLKKMADYFDTSVDYLIGHSDDSRKIQPYSETSLSPEEVNHLQLYRSMSPRLRSLIDSLMEEYCQ